MPKPPSSDPSGRGRPNRPGRPGSSSGRAGARSGAPGRTGGPPRTGGRDGGRGADRGSKRADDGVGEGPPWKRRAEARAKDDTKGKAAGWGGVARKGAGRLRDEGRGSGASAAFREAAGPEAWEPEVWIDEGVVRGEAEGAVDRGRSEPRRRRRGAALEEAPAEADASLQRAVGPAKAERIESKLRDAGRAFRRERFEESRKILRPLAESVPTAASVRELLGLTYYRLGRWRMAVAELEAFRQLASSTEQHPVLADCYRALGRHGKVAELWDELRDASPSAALVAEGRIVYAGSLADQGKLRDAIDLLEAAKRPAKRPKEHHLRVTYALADLYERAGDVPRARQLFGVVAAAEPELGDVAARIRALG